MKAPPSQHKSRKDKPIKGQHKKHHRTNMPNGIIYKTKVLFQGNPQGSNKSKLNMQKKKKIYQTSIFNSSQTFYPQTNPGTVIHLNQTNQPRNKSISNIHQPPCQNSVAYSFKSQQISLKKNKKQQYHLIQSNSTSNTAVYHQSHKNISYKNKTKKKTKILPMLPDRSSLLFDAQEKNKCQMLVDQLLDSKYAQIGRSQQLTMSFTKISQDNDKKKKKQSQFTNDNTVDSLENNNNNSNTQLYSVFVHRIFKNEVTSSNINPSSPSTPYEFDFISPVAIPDITDVELIISSNRVSYSMKFIENLQITKKHLQCIYEFNLNFLKDMTQEGTQLNYLPFDEFLGSQHTHKLFVIFDKTTMEMFNYSKTKQLKNLPDNLFLKSIFENQRFDAKNGQSQEESEQLSMEDMLSSRALISQLFEQQQQKKMEMKRQHKEEKKQLQVISRDQQQLCQEQPTSLVSIEQQKQQIENNGKDQSMLLSNTEQLIEDSELQDKQSSSDAVSVAGGVATLQDGQFWYDLSNPDGYRESSVILTNPLNNPSTFQNISKLTQDKFIRHHFLPQDHFQFLDILDPCNTTVYQFLQLLGQILEMDALEVAKKIHLKILPQDAQSIATLESTTLFNCIYESPQRFLEKHCQIFHTIRKHFVLSQTTGSDKQNHEYSWNNAGFKSAFGMFNRRNPLVLTKKTVHLKNFEYINALTATTNNNSHTSSIPPVLMSSLKQTNFKDASKLSLILLPIEHFSINPLSIAQIDSMLQSFGIFQQIKEHLIAYDYSKFLDMDNQVNIQLLLEALSMPGYNQNKNLEVLEVLGDVVIKYVSSLFLYRRLPDKRENILTHTRSLFINNKFLGIVAFQNGLHFYARTKKPTSFEWRLNYIKEGIEGGGGDDGNQRLQLRQDCKQGKLTYSNLSDMLEAVIGSFYESQEFKLDCCLKVCSSLGLTIDRRLKIEVPQLVEGSFLMPRNILEEAMKVKEKMTYRDLQMISRSDWKKKQENKGEEEKRDDEDDKGDNKKSEIGIGSYDNKDINQQHRIQQQDFVWIEIAEMLSKEKEFQRLFEDNKQDQQNYKNNTSNNNNNNNKNNNVSSFNNNMTNPTLSDSQQDHTCMNMITTNPHKNAISDPNERRRYRREYKKYSALHSEKLTSALKSFEDNCLGYKFKDKRLLITALNCGCDDLAFNSRIQGELDLNQQTQNDSLEGKNDQEEEQKRRSSWENSNNSKDIDIKNDSFEGIQYQNRKRNSKMKDKQIVSCQSYHSCDSGGEEEEQKEQILQNKEITRFNGQRIMRNNVNTKDQQVIQSIVDLADKQADKNIQLSYQQSSSYQSHYSPLKSTIEQLPQSKSTYDLLPPLNSTSISTSSSYGCDYQKLEFLGDSLIEILVVSNAFYLSRSGYGDGLKCPYAFCELKSLLLSNDFLSRVAVLNGFHQYALNISSSAVDEIIKFISLVDFDVEFSSSISHQNTSPKVLGDLWESIAAAVLIDSDVNTFVKVYGKLYAPFISHFVKYYNSLVFNPKEKVQLVAQQLKLKFHVSTENSSKCERGSGKLHYFENKYQRQQEYPQQQQYQSNNRLDGDDNMIKKTVFLNNVAIGIGEGDSELLAERKAFHEAYQRLFVRCDTNLGFVFHGKNI